MSISERERNMTADDFRAQAARSKQASYESFERCDTDGFLSQWANDIGARLDLEKAEILDAGGVSRFVGLYTIDGERVPAKVVHSKINYQPVTSWLLRADAAAKYGRRYIPYNPRKPGRIQKALGLCHRYETAPAWASIMGSGKGLSGCASAFVGRYRLGDEWGMDATLVADVD